LARKNPPAKNMSFSQGFIDSRRMKACGTVFVMDSRDTSRAERGLKPEMSRWRDNFEHLNFNPSS
jgi:hypothetical protein